MIVTRGAGPVGKWWFEGDEDVEPTGRANLAELLRRLEQVAQVFEAAELLRPRSLTFSGWLSGSYAAGTLERVDGDDVVVELPDGASGLAERALTAVGEERYPVDVDVSGTGVVLDEEGQGHEQGDVVWLGGLAQPPRRHRQRAE